ncbi:ABC transporter permease subunit, partial [Klebsiella pneumoniae]|uniref:ABC transporter permease subunit n=1 Tax=Klebsiella pneumoniae TaxID=573 RepID=UPI0013D16C57
FRMQAATLLEAARSLGAGPGRVFRSVALPLARPAIALGLGLALMEALNDIGAAEFLGVRTSFTRSMGFLIALAGTGLVVLFLRNTLVGKAVRAASED